MKQFDNKIVLIGGGGHCLSCIDVIESHNKFKIIGIIEKHSELKIKEKYGYPIIGTDKDLHKIFNLCNNALIAFGFIKNVKERIQLYNQIRKLQFKTPSFVSPYSYFSKRAKISDGSIIMHGCTINAGVKIKRNCIINSSTLIEHESIIGSNCHISTGVKINGNCLVGDGTFIGSGSVIFEGLDIKPYSVIPAGSVVNQKFLKLFNEKNNE